MMFVFGISNLDYPLYLYICFYVGAVGLFLWYLYKYWKNEVLFGAPIKYWPYYATEALLVTSLVLSLNRLHLDSIYDPKFLIPGAILMINYKMRTLVIKRA